MNWEIELDANSEAEAGELAREIFEQDSGRGEFMGNLGMFPELDGEGAYVEELDVSEAQH